MKGELTCIMHQVEKHYSRHHFWLRRRYFRIEYTEVRDKGLTLGRIPRSAGN